VRRQLPTEDGDQPYLLSFSDDGQRMATVEVNRREAVVWEVASGDLLTRIPLGTDGEGSDLGATGSTVYTAGSDGALRHWDVDGKRRFIAQVARAPFHGLDAMTGYPAPGGRIVAYAGKYDRDDVVFFDVGSGRVTAKVPRGHQDFERRAAGTWHPDGVHFALATGGEIRVWDARDGRLTARWTASGEAISALDYSADGTALVVSELSGQVTLLDEHLSSLGRPVRLADPVGDVAAGPDGRSAVALTGVDDASGFWVAERKHWELLDLVSGRVVRQGELGFQVRDLDFSPDGRHVAIAGSPGSLPILDVATGKLVSQPISSLHQPSWVTYSPDGRRALTSSGEASDALWDGVTGELLVLVATPERNTVAGFGQDSDSVLTVGAFGGPVLRWDAGLERAVEFACRVAGRDFTEQEWSEQFGDRQFEQTCPAPAT
jgi:WD40 repeat protein